MPKPTMVDIINAAIVEEYFKAGFVAVGVNPGLAALRAMRKPSNKMLNAAGKAMSPECRPTQKRISVKAKHAVRFTAMIDAAIEEAAQ